MKTLISVILFAFASAPVLCAADLRSPGVRLKRSTADLFATGNPTAAVAQLRNSVTPAPGTDGATVALVQGLIDLAASFYNQRQLKLARDVASQAFTAAEPILSGRSAASVIQRAGLLSSLGLLAENVALDLRRAESLYDQAATLAPADRIHADRKRAVLAKQKPRT